MISEDDLDFIARRCDSVRERVPPGPWLSDGARIYAPEEDGSLLPIFDICDPARLGPAHAFLVCARQDVPDLLAMVRELQEQAPGWTWWETAWPAESGWYLVEVNQPGSEEARPVAFYEAHEGTWSWDGGAPMRSHVTHWAPIPRRQVLGGVNDAE